MNGLIQGVKVRLIKGVTYFKLITARLLGCWLKVWSVSPGLAVFHERAVNRRLVRCLGQEIFSVGDGVFHLRTHPSDETQPLVRLYTLHRLQNIPFQSRAFI